MGFSDFFSAVVDSFSHPSPDAESPPTGGASTTNTPASGTNEESSGEADVNKKDAAKHQDDGEPQQGHKPGESKQVKEEAQSSDDDEEEEEEETVDPKDAIEAECQKSKACAPAKHHYDECAERVTGQIESDGKAKEDCVEEFFHLAHCATQCAAPKLWAELK